MHEITKTDAETPDIMRWFWIVFLILAALVYFFGLTIPLVGPDEPRYAEVAREMFDRSDWITPTLGGFDWFEKPALLYWLEVLAYHIFGVTEFAARLGSALCGIGTIACLWLLASKASGLPNNDPSSTSFANWVFLIGASTIGIIAFSHGASFDIIVTFPVTASLVSFFIFEKRQEKERGGLLWLLSFYFFVGVALLAKGLIGVVFPFGIIGFYQLFSGRWPSRNFLISLVWGPFVAIVIAATWYLPMYLRHGWQFIDEFIIQQHFQRFTSNKYQHPQPFYFFFWVLPLMTIPWLPFFVIAIWKDLARFVKGLRSEGRPTDREDGSSNSLFNFSYAWLLVPLLFFSFSGSKLPGYILPAVPAAIIITAIYVFRFVQESRFRSLLIKGIAVSTFVVILIALFFFVPGFARKESVRSLIATADAHGYSSLPVAGFLTVSHNAEFYAHDRLIRDEDGKQHRFDGPHDLAAYIRSHSDEPVLALVPLEHVQNLTNNDLFQAQVLEQNGELAVVFLILKS